MAPSFGIPQKVEKPRHGIRKRDIASYVFLPKVLPRFADLFLTGFHFFAFFMAQVYRGVRLLPADHPSLNPANMGQYGVRDIISEAARHLVWKRENIDQIVVFLAILAGLILLILQVGTFMVAFAIPQASAADPTFGFSSIFGQVNDPSQDIAFILLDRVFGVQGIFDSCISTATPCYGVSQDALKFDTEHTIYKPDAFPWPYHEGLHALFQFYSMGLLLVAVFILLYYVIVIVAETAQTGTPFGKRFNTVWAPIRLVMAFGLLIPISNGLNSAQYITLYAAKWGSNFATNGWVIFNKAIDEKAVNLLQGDQAAVKPKEPEVNGLLQFMTLAHTCKVFEETLSDKALATDDAATTGAAEGCTDDHKGKQIEAYIVKPGVDEAHSHIYLKDASYDDALAFSENNDIQIRFGDRNCKKDYAMAGNIQPDCGEITLPINSITEAGPKSVQQGYYNLIKYLWGGYGGGDDISTYSNPQTDPNQDSRPELFACDSSKYNDILQSGQGNYDQNIRKYALSYYQNGANGQGGICVTNAGNKTNPNYNNLLAPPEPGWEIKAFKSYMYGSDADAEEESDIDTQVSSYPGYTVDSDFIIRNILKKGVKDLQAAVDAGGTYNMSNDNLARGWAVAGIWYNKIAEMNGGLIGAAWDLPAPNRFPAIMMEVLSEKRQNNSETAPDDMFCPTVAGGDMKNPLGADGIKFANTMCQVYNHWSQANPKKSTGNVMADFVNLIFGTQGLFDLRYQQNQRAHPLAMLVGVGKGLIEASIRNLGIGMGTGLVGIVAALGVGGTATPELTASISSFFFSIATLTLTAGFILFYVIPFLPFLYFFFAVGNWLKGVFEAMVGVPLWALAHLRIDGNGLPGEAALNGYFMLFEIFLRPIMILFGFLASITIFSAMATVLHEVFEVAVTNLTGAGGTGASHAIDNFFYTVMYAVIMYIMALSSFKLIDLIPNQIMRWMGTNISTFSDMNQDAAGNLTNMTAIAGSQVVSGLTGGLQQGMGGLARGAGALRQGMMPKQG